MTEKVPLSKPCSVAPREWRRTCSSDGEVTASWLAETADGRQQTRPRQDERDQFLIDAAAAFRPVFCRTNRYLITLRTSLPGWRAP
jgi:hypothetical protein